MGRGVGGRGGRGEGGGGGDPVGIGSRESLSHQSRLGGLGLSEYV